MEALDLLEVEEVRAGLPKVKNARLAAWAAVVVAPAPEPFHMWALARDHTSRRPRTSMLDVVATSTQFAPEETSLALSRLVVC